MIYNFKEIEENLYKWWQDNGYFKIKDISKCPKGNFSIILPPPNVTGKLHMGHALDGSLQDVIYRFKMLDGYRTYWASGTDHAGISAQSKVEKLLSADGIDPKKLSRNDLFNTIDTWAKEQIKFIRQQWKKIGLSLTFDPENPNKYELFTLDHSIHQTIYIELENLYKDGLLYRDVKLVNWDVKQKTAISDLEVIKKPTKSKLWYFKYYLENSNTEYLIIATTRPETMFVDTNVVINPNDERFKKYIGKNFINPINGEKLKMITDDSIEMDFGTGVMKLTPAHDFNDFSIAKKNNITKYDCCIELDGKLNSFANNKYFNLEGTDRIIARKTIIEVLNKMNLIEKIDENYENNIGYSERSGEIVEPLFSLQWFVKMQPIVNKMKDLFKQNKEINFISEGSKESFFRWINNIQDWCISRQLVWGHRLPIWYHKTTKEIYVNHLPPTDIENWEQDNDVLDTWFSSGLWPLVCTKEHRCGELKDFYPVDFCQMGWDIIFFWFARMIMQCAYYDSEISIKNIFIHGLVLSEDGRKMSKSWGNVISPDDEIEKYGIDALRFYLISNCTGDNMNYIPQKIEFVQRYLNKIYNIKNLTNNVNEKYEFEFDKLNFLNKWIVVKFNNFLKSYTENFNNYKLTTAADMILNFSWDLFANKYLEMIRKIEDKENQNIINYIYKQILILLHPFCPFITENIYQEIFKSKKSILDNIIPQSKKFNLDEEFFTNTFIDTVNICKDIRIKKSLKNSIILDLNLITEKTIDIEKLNNYLKNFSINIIKVVTLPTDNNKKLEKFSYGFLEFNNNFDTNQSNEKEKLIIFLKEEITRCEKILSNENFIKRANPEKVKLEQEKLEKYKNELKSLL